MKWMTAANALEATPCAAESTIFLNCQDEIAAATGLEPAVTADQRAERPLVNADGRGEEPGRQAPNTFDEAVHVIGGADGLLRGRTFRFRRSASARRDAFNSSRVGGAGARTTQTKS